MGYRSNKTPGVVRSLCFLMDGETANRRLYEAEMKACKVSVEIATSKGNRDGQLAVLADHSSGVSESYLGNE